MVARVLLPNVLAVLASLLAGGTGTVRTDTSKHGMAWPRHAMQWQHVMVPTWHGSHQHGMYGDMALAWPQHGMAPTWHGMALEWSCPCMEWNGPNMA